MLLLSLFFLTPLFLTLEYKGGGCWPCPSAVWMPWMGFGSQSNPAILPCLLALSCLQERAEKEHIDELYTGSCRGMKLAKENTINPQGYFPYPMAMVEGAKSCTQVSESEISEIHLN